MSVLSEEIEPQRVMSGLARFYSLRISPQCPSSQQTTSSGGWARGILPGLSWPPSYGWLKSDVGGAAGQRGEQVESAERAEGGKSKAGGVAQCK